MERLLRRRKCLRSPLDGIVKEAEGRLREQELSSSQVSVSIDRINAIYAQITKIDESLIDETPDELIEAEIKDASKYGEKIVTLTAKLRFAILDNQASQASRPTTSQALTTTSQASVGLQSRLPQLELQKFDGNRQKWHGFWMQFSTAVYNNDDLRAAEKFNYLSTLVTGTAAAAISGLQATGECYEDAMNILKKGFGDERIIVQEHLQSLLDLRPVLSSSSTTKLRDLYNEVQVHVRSLKALGTSPNTYCSMLREILLRVIPSHLVLKYHELHKPMTTTVSTMQARRDPQDRTTEIEKELEDLLDFLEHQLHCRETLAACTEVCHTRSGLYPNQEHQ
ncbi:uncharacterized protein LOC119397164 [Rhipicephalus sanguineus]|uniref:uncharacterized protein LOC119397164 n=1 Tax=Rhipicephalus sanguineus TaxID=34632 RepID=UPI0018939572|nr:uncharacterized protein LOC119397164 [Rhipicephalus sanguineus]